MTKAAGMFGSDAAAVRLHAKFRSERIHLEKQNFRHPDDILAHLSKTPEIDVVLLVEKAVKTQDLDMAETLQTLRAGDPTIRIIVIKDEPERDYPFEIWCYEWGIYDVFYPSRHTDVNIDAIRDAILCGRIDLDNPPAPPVEPNTEPDANGRLKLRDKLPSLPEFRFPDIKLPEWKMPSLSEFMRNPKSKKEEPQTSVPEMDIRTVGVINCSRGFGATSLVAGMAQCLSCAGYSAAVIAMDLSPDLEFAGLEETGITTVIPSGDRLPDWEALSAEHDFLLVDFGAIYDFLPSGDFLPAQSGASAAVAVRDALKLCDLHIYLASAEPWHRRKAKAFSHDEKGYVILRQEAEASAILHLIGAIEK